MPQTGWTVSLNRRGEDNEFVNGRIGSEVYLASKCSQMKDYETLPPMVIDHGKGPWLSTSMGNAIWISSVHGGQICWGITNPEINAAIKTQVDRLEHVIFANFSHEPAIELAGSWLDHATRHQNSISTIMVRQRSSALKMCFPVLSAG